ncbi:DUF7691 family protein [Nocardia sp. NPDC004722]
MSYGIMPYAVDLEGIRLFGSYGQEFVDETLERVHPQMLARLEGPAHEAKIEPQDLVRHLLRGEPTVPGVGHLYGYALEAVCDTHGRALSNVGWSGMRFGYFDVVGAALAGIGVDFEPSSLVFGGVPARLPDVDDFPSIGSLEVDEIEDLAAGFAAADLDLLADAGIRESAGTIEGWLHYCRRQGLGLVCFYY